MSRQARFLPVVALSALLAAPTYAQDAATTEAPGTQTAASEIPVETVVATVNGTEITVGHMIALYEHLPDQYKALPPGDLFGGILDQLIQQTALSQEADGSLTKRDILGLENEARAYKAGTVLDRVARAAVTDDAVQSAFEAEYAGAEPSQEFNAAHILLETEEAAQEIKAELDGGADFAELAKEKSVGPSGPNGGELGWFGMGMMVKSFEDAVVTLEPGAISDPVETQFGWHVIRLNETRNVEIPTLDEVRGDIEGGLRQTAVQEKVSELVAAAEVERMTDGIDPAVLTQTGILDN